MYEAIKIVGIVAVFVLVFIRIAYYATQPSQINEEVIIQRIVDITRKRQKPGKREQHPNACGIVWAQFKVDPNIPNDLRIGIFGKPNDPNNPEDFVPAWIRFSKAIGDDDSRRMGGVGMAIKLMDVDGKRALECDHSSKTQDFLLFNSPVFFLRDVLDSISFLEYPILFVGSRWRLTLILIRLFLHRNKSLVEQPYWSATPYQLGLDLDPNKKAVKYCAKPLVNHKYTKPANKETLGESLERKLHTHDVYFDFCVQVQTDSKKMPIEDPTIEWSERESEFVKVATIRIPRQTFNSKEQQEFGENLSFTPCHSLPEHTPLGGINRVRKAVYLATAKTRRSDNGDEPTPDTFKPNLDP